MRWAVADSMRSNPPSTPAKSGNRLNASGEIILPIYASYPVLALMFQEPALSRLS
jgi:hypothetical protein